MYEFMEESMLCIFNCIAYVIHFLCITLHNAMYHSYRPWCVFRIFNPILYRRKKSGT